MAHPHKCKLHTRWLILGGAVVLIAGLWWTGPLAWKRAQERAAARATTAQLQELEAAKARWAARPFSRYRLAVQADSSLARCAQDLEVHGTEPAIVLENTCPSTLTMEDLLASIESTITARECGPNGCECDGFVAIDVVYDQQWGYPRSIRRFLQEDWTTRPWPLRDLFRSRGCTLVGIVFYEFTVTIRDLGHEKGFQKTGPNSLFSDPNCDKM